MSTKREQIIQLVKEYYQEEFESKKKDFEPGDVQGLCRCGDALFPGHGKKIVQSTQFHRHSLLCRQYIGKFHNCQLWNYIIYKYLLFLAVGPTL